MDTIAYLKAQSISQRNASIGTGKPQQKQQQIPQPTCASALRAAARHSTPVIGNEHTVSHRVI